MMILGRGRRGVVTKVVGEGRLDVEMTSSGDPILDMVLFSFVVKNGQIYVLNCCP